MISFDIILAVGFIAVVFSGAVVVFFTAQDVTSREKTRGERTSAEIALADEMRARARVDFSGLLSTTTVRDGFTLSAQVDDIDDVTKDVTVGPFSIRVFDWHTALGQKTCYFKGDWSAATVSEPLLLPASTTATRVSVAGKYAFLTADSAEASKEDFFVINVEDPLHPYIVAKLDTGPGLMTIKVAGRYAYVGNSSILAQLQIIDVSDPVHPFLVSTFKLPGVYTDGTTIANSLYYSRGRIYLGTRKSQITELHIIDVSNPYAPHEIGSWETNTAVNAILAKGNLLYLASPDSEELKVLDISNPASSTRVSGFDAPGGSGNGKSLESQGTTTYLGRTLGGNEFFILDTSSTTPAVKGMFQTSSSIEDIVTSEGMAILATTDPAREVQILSTLTPSLITRVASIDLPNRAISLDCGQGSLYVALQSNDGFRILTPQ